MAYPSKLGMGHNMYIKLSNSEKEVIKELISSLNKEDIK